MYTQNEDVKKTYQKTNTSNATLFFLSQSLVVARDSEKGPQGLFSLESVRINTGDTALRPSPPLSFLSVRTNKVQESSFQKINK